MTEAVKEKRKHLMELSKVIKLKIAHGLIEAESVNQGLMELYGTKNGEPLDIEFDTFHGWKEKGFKIKKGSQAFLIWGKPRKGIVKSEKGEETEDPEEEFKFWPLCYLFSSEQVEK